MDAWDALSPRQQAQADQMELPLSVAVHSGEE